jgi:hypothetical protein
MEHTNNVPSKLEGPRGIALINSGEKYSAVIYFLQNESVRESNHDSTVNNVYGSFALKRRAST